MFFIYTNKKTSDFRSTHLFKWLALVPFLVLLNLLVLTSIIYDVYYRCARFIFFVASMITNQSRDVVFLSKVTYFHL